MITLRKTALLVAALWLLVAAYAALIAWEHIQGTRRARNGETPLYTDYTPTYAASLLIRRLPPENLYLPRPMAAAEREAAKAQYAGITDEQARAVGFSAWMYPPTFILLVAPLAALPYLASWFAWIALTALPYLAAMRRILPAPLAWPFALAAPPTFFNVMYGQTGFLTSGLIGMGLTLLGSRPVAAGILIGLASFKPHFGVLVPFALAAGGYWRTFAAASATVLASIVASVIALGDDPWLAFIGTSQFHLEGFAAGAFNFAPMTTVLATLRMAGASLDSAWTAQYIVAALMVLIVLWTWRRGRSRPDTLGLQCATLCLATPLAIPMAYLYDLALIVPAAAWLWVDLGRRDAPAAEKAFFGVAMASLLSVKAIATTFGIQIGAVILAVLLGLTLRRYLSALRSPP
ncbi:glycosyltransferase family 87 protein [Azoarcus sp. KH32C]|uniref:glycosyltransferase family 87 protein n=1 Tax=Azoarcus sp. KH32C TaxID=748247 RepID=UPI0002386AFD|nr:glycosyltransferase family 87 protein [Azoarcus sp. KH32C]BAL22729.1 hypothetical protein AZKH_0383 [Azoarcus sp. KH32C]